MMIRKTKTTRIVDGKKKHKDEVHIKAKIKLIYVQEEPKTPINHLPIREKKI